MGLAWRAFACLRESFNSERLVCLKRKHLNKKKKSNNKIRKTQASMKRDRIPNIERSYDRVTDAIKKMTSLIWNRVERIPRFKHDRWTKNILG